MRELMPRTLDDIAGAAINVTVTREIRATPDVVFEALADASSWPEWHLLNAAAWVTPTPHGVGSRRKVGLGPQTVLEEFIAWEPGRTLAFTLIGVEGPGHQALQGGVELLAMRPGTIGRTVLDYTFAIDVAGPSGLVGPLAAPGVRLGLGRALSALDQRLS